MEMYLKTCVIPIFVLHNLFVHKEDTIMHQKSRLCFVIPPVGVGPFSRALLRFRRSSIMDTVGHSSPIWVYRANAHKMRASHDEDRSKPKDMWWTWTYPFNRTHLVCGLLIVGRH